MKPTLINNLEIAKKQETLAGEMTAKECNRLIEGINHAQEDDLHIQYQLTGHTSTFHLPSLHLTVDALLPLICQRCLDAMQVRISLTFDYVISEEEPEAFNGDDDVDWVEASREMNLNELIEDELLIAIPLAPTHDHACKPLKLESGEKHNPFAALKGLVK